MGFQKHLRRCYCIGLVIYGSDDINNKLGTLSTAEILTFRTAVADLPATDAAERRGRRRRGGVCGCCCCESHRYQHRCHSLEVEDDVVVVPSASDTICSSIPASFFIILVLDLIR